MTGTDLRWDVEELRAEVRATYRAVATDPGAARHFHTGRPMAARLDYPVEIVDGLPDAAVEPFAGVGNRPMHVSSTCPATPSWPGARPRPDPLDTSRHDDAPYGAGTEQTWPVTRRSSSD